MAKKVEVRKTGEGWVWYCQSCQCALGLRTFTLALQGAIHHCQTHDYAKELVLGYPVGGTVWQRMTNRFIGKGYEQ